MSQNSELYLTSCKCLGLALAIFLVLPPSISAILEQPDTVPQVWSLPSEPLPPLNAVIAQGATRRPVYGLYCWASEYLAYHDVIQQVGWKNFRLSGPINDAVMQQYAEDGVEVMYTLAARRPFASANFPNGEWRNRSSYGTDEAFILDYVEDVKSVLQRYGPDGDFFQENPDLPYFPLRFIEVFNEPNFWYIDVALDDIEGRQPPTDPDERSAQEARRQALYAKLLHATYSAIKADWPSVQVVGFAAGGSAKQDTVFIDGVHAALPEVAESYDILSTHPYNNPAPPDADSVRSWGQYSPQGTTSEIRATMNTYGSGNRDIWWTELNWGIHSSEGGYYNLPEDRTLPQLFQAAYYLRGYLLALRLGIERLNYMALVDTDGVNAGMFQRGTTPPAFRASALAIKQLIELMPHPVLKGALSDGADGVHVPYYESAPGSNGSLPDTLALWRVGGPASVKLNWPKNSLVIQDMLGNRHTVYAEDGAVTFNIGPYPVFIKYAGDWVEDLLLTISPALETIDYNSPWFWGANNPNITSTGLAVSNAGQGLPNENLLPTRIAAGIRKITATASGAIALTRLGKVQTVGLNTFGQLGEPSVDNRLSFVTVPFIDSAMDIASGFNTRFALTTAGTVYSWGSNDFGLLGRNFTDASDPVPAAIPGVSGAKSIASGGDWALAVIEDGSLRTWGRGSSFRLGNTSSKDSPVPIDPGLSQISNACAGEAFGLALHTNGTLTAWGANDEGQLGIGTQDARSPHTPVKVLNADTGQAFDNVTAIACGKNFAIALRADGSVWAWGQGDKGQLGQGDYENRLYPTRITKSFPAIGAKAIAAGNDTAYILDHDGFVWASGSNVAGALGEDSAIPVRDQLGIVVGLPPIGRLHAAYQGVLAIGEGMNYSQFQNLHFQPAELNNPLISGADADPDADGIPNLFEFYLREDPKASNDDSPLHVTLDTGETFIRASYQQNAWIDAPGPVMLQSDNLNDWVEAKPKTKSITDRGNYWIFHLDFETSEKDALFLRLRQP